MATYEYHCPNCGCFLTDYPIGEAPPTNVCAGCGIDAERVFSIGAIKKSIPEHWNVSLQRYINTEREFNDALKAKSEEAEARTGVPHNFERLDPGEITPIDDSGLRSTHDAKVKRGEREPTSRLIA